MIKSDESKTKKQDSLFEKALLIASSVDGVEEGELSATMKEILATNSSSDKKLNL